MHYWLIPVISVLLLSCTPDGYILTEQIEMVPSKTVSGLDPNTPANPEQIVKSPQGYVLNGPKDRFGGFIGDCSSDENFPYYWECQAESAGDNFH